MALRVNNPNNVRVYTVSGDNLSRSLPDWLEKKRRRQLNKDLGKLLAQAYAWCWRLMLDGTVDFRHRVELLQDFEFPEAAIRVKTTADGKYAMATGVYKPQIRVFEYAEMSMKFERHTDAENILSDDWTKSVHLQNDRSVEFHAQGGIHYRTRIPKFGRDLAYHYPSCDLMISAAGAEVYRLNLDQGRFLNPLVTDATGGVNVCEVNPAHQLFGFGTADGTVEFWDPRARARVGLLAPHMPSSADAQGLEVTALKFRHDGLSMALGTSTGQTMLYDMRHPRPWLVKDQQYGLPIISVHWHDGAGIAADATDADGTTLESEGGGKVISADAKIVKIWDRNTGALFTSIEPSADINSVCPVTDSGMIFTANECSRMHIYYIPALGPAPRWCSFLDNLTEEMEENPQQTTYDDYKFVTKKELESLGMDHLIGTNVLKAYMHGYFVDLRLYEKAKLIANPFAYEEHRKRAIAEKLEKQRESRIRATIKLPKVNRELAARLATEESSKRSKKKAEAAENLLKDDRFADMFANPDFQVDEASEEYRLLNPSSMPVSGVSMDVPCHAVPLVLNGATEKGQLRGRQGGRER
ncbi:WD40-repeat-containing domain protein [Syncephalis pseudoplumigaleata]|uniref:WD40-repeat-containing domain protein n=1 Tax=Syncephalis pseudoplumigaleata TaxID=1712513 RepID=A0A4P9Z4S1_9FUNG|nr:WD40-repeat-containing domain protein [Syncephalis pseudoplumigaleata]|eukprot:RKP27465.1 WD40-repeat-containing domain protein [Syncephalis pseudoplumigaleata]